MKTIKQVLEEFLTEQQARLKPNTYRGYADAISLFKQCLNNYAYQSLCEKDAKLFDKFYSEQNKEFCEIFGPDKIDAPEIGEFLEYFMIKKVMCGKELLKTVGKVMRKFVKWMKEKGYMNEEKYENAAKIVDELKNELPKVQELSDLIYDYIQKNPSRDFIETEEGYFKVIKIKSGKLWLKDSLGDEIGPVFVSPKISSMCKLGWVICLELGKTSQGWKMLESGNVYPN